MEAHGVGLTHENAAKRPAVRRVVVVDEEVGDEHHGLDGPQGGAAQVRAHPQRLVARRGVKLGRFLALPRGRRRHKLRPQSQHDEDESHKGGFCLVLLWQAQGPKVLVVGVKGLAVEHGVDGVDALKVPGEEDVGLQLVGEDGDHLGQTALTGPVVGKGVFGSNAKEVGRAGRRVGHIGEQAGGGCYGDRVQGVGSVRGEAPICDGRERRPLDP